MSYYEINISKNGQHFFATAERSCTTTREAREVLRELIARFPREDGFEIGMTWTPRSSYGIDPYDVLTDEHFDPYRRTQS
jgi:hypothetical protein